MRGPLFFLFFILLSIPFTLVSTLSSDGHSLLSLSKNLTIPTSILSTWTASDPDPCNWTGVECGRRHNYVVTLNLSGTGVSGTLGPHIGRLRFLRTLDLAINNISGSIPPELGNCSRLSYLDLSNNYLSGELGMNSLSGVIPESLNRLKNLYYFDLSENHFSGKITYGSENCTNMQYLDLSYNSFDGGIPSRLRNCTGMNTFAAVFANLAGPIPSWFGSFSQLSLLYLSQNHLSGPIPPEIGKCSSLTELLLKENLLDGVIPAELGMLRNLTKLWLYTNHLRGEIPIEIWKIPTLEEVFIYNNSLSGQLPVEITELRHLKNLSLFNNDFSGVVPKGLGLNSSIEELDLSHNRFSGEIPPNLCFSKHLERLILAYNQFQGSIPLDIGECSSLWRLRLDHNNLSGPLPHLLENSGLSYMDLSMNNINGSIPPSLGNCRDITLINLSNNRLAGLIPLEIGNLVKLQVLDLSSNVLSGPLPPQISHCEGLQKLDMGFNSINGSIPLSLSKLTGLRYLVLQNNRFTGEIPDIFGQFQQLLDLRMGGNLLEGGIPESFGKLTSLNIELDLSDNGLIGGVSPLASLNSLPRLDLSGNNLSDNLTKLGALSSLNEVNISYNHFMGPIPVSWIKFLRSSPSSFLGNSDICIPCQEGEPNCTDVSNVSPCSRSSKKKGGLSKMKIVLVTVWSVVFCVLVFLMLGYLILKRRREAAKKDEVPLQGGSIFTLNQIMEVTDMLNEKYVIGRGAHGTVYKAYLSPDEIYAVKKLTCTRKKGLSMSMVREIQTVGKIRHRNLVRLVDFWVRTDYGLILYDYMENGSLHDVLHEIKPPPILLWEVRFKIALGIAQGLKYLHHDCNLAIVHRDIKPKNILLDLDMEPHISDFGIATLIDTSVSPKSSVIIGTIGYMSPETAFTTRKSKESDVYSYGVVLLELITRLKAVDPSFPENTDIVSWVNSNLNGREGHCLDRIVDPGLIREFMGSRDMEEVAKVLLLALRCTAKEAGNRPSMGDVVKQLTDLKMRLTGHAFS
ncbi:Receptor-like protein kinase [Acorus gramineus]|uniref:non-specific serine/threonine protein kinase n=1 Tax=Acorus gramineus TaxID=55184 RepID=A0AAV9BJT6_ACOGR|nr:Receptor-like protein kinase [Acorus gramineus]